MTFSADGMTVKKGGKKPPSDSVVFILTDSDPFSVSVSKDIKTHTALSPFITQLTVQRSDVLTPKKGSWF